MTELENFRLATREWLEANCPNEMRQPVKEEEDVFGADEMLRSNQMRKDLGLRPVSVKVIRSQPGPKNMEALD